MQNSQTILIGLNEINFEFLEAYIEKGKLKNFKKLLSASKVIETVSENEYKLLEPWIQWVTVYTGKPYAEHQIFRLGDIVERPELGQIFEELEAKGKSIGAISPFNAANKLNKAKFFVPDPWTKTKVSGHWFVQRFYKAIHQAVNDNAQEKISFSSIMTLGLAYLRYVPIPKWSTYLNLLLKRKKPGIKAIILDNLLIDVFLSLWKSSKPDFANIFLNSGAHIQHHYMYNSSVYKGGLTNPEWYCPKDWDPLEIVLEQYDKLVGKLLDKEDLKILIATGLHQQPHKHETYYWRLKDHASFLNEIGVNNYKEVLPRMSIDFLINFNNVEDTEEAEQKLGSFINPVDNEKVFEIDNRGDSLFIELVYHGKLDSNSKIVSREHSIEVSGFNNKVSFVAIKNGEHNGIGYLTSNVPLKVSGKIPLTQVKDLISSVVLG